MKRSWLSVRRSLCCGQRGWEAVCRQRVISPVMRIAIAYADGGPLAQGSQNPQ
jgi:hypothetical protein